jgi:predicted Zn-dependent peptidase
MAASGLHYPITERVLDNGLRVVASPDHGSASAAVNLWYGVGPATSIPDGPGWRTCSNI